MDDAAFDCGLRHDARGLSSVATFLSTNVNDWDSHEGILAGLNILVSFIVFRSFRQFYNRCSQVEKRVNEQSISLEKPMVQHFKV